MLEIPLEEGGVESVPVSGRGTGARQGQFHLDGIGVGVEVKGFAVGSCLKDPVAHVVIVMMMMMIVTVVAILRGRTIGSPSALGALEGQARGRIIDGISVRVEFFV